MLLKSQLRQLSSQLDAEAEAQKKAARAHSEELAEKDAQMRHEVRSLEEKFRADLEKTRLDAVRNRACVRTGNPPWCVTRAPFVFHSQSAMETQYIQSIKQASARERAELQVRHGPEVVVGVLVVELGSVWLGRRKSRHTRHGSGS